MMKPEFSRGAMMVLPVLMIAGCAGESPEQQSMRLITEHLVEDLFPAWNEDGSFSVIELEIVTERPGEREVSAILSSGDEREEVRIRLMEAESGWEVARYGPNLARLVAFSAGEELRREYEEVLEHVSRFVQAFRSRRSHLISLTSMQVIGEDRTAARETQAELALLAREEGVRSVIESMRPRLAPWLTWEAITDADGDVTAVVFRTSEEALVGDIECATSPVFTRDSAPPELVWADRWDGEACRGGTAVWLGALGTADAAQKIIEEQGVWTGW